MTDVRITAAIPAFNAERFIAEAVQSVLSQSYPCFECLVIDDGSTDDTEQIVNSFDGVRYVWQANGGVAKARNRAIDEARGDLIAFLDADDIWLPEKIQVQVERFMRNQDLGLIYTGLVVVDANLDPLEQIRPAPGNVALRNTLLAERPYITGIGSTGLVPLDVAKEVRFDERLSSSADWDFGCGVAIRHPVDSIDRLLVLYRQHGKGQMHRGLGIVEQDMTLIADKFFSDPALDLGVRSPRRRARSNLCVSLAAGYFRRRDLATCARYLVEAFLLRPDRVVAAFWRYSRSRLLSLGVRRHAGQDRWFAGASPGSQGVDVTEQRQDRRSMGRRVRRRGKEARERALAGILLVFVSPVLAGCAVAIALEALLRREARGPIFFREKRISSGRVIDLLKFRTLDATALRSLGPGPTHIAVLEKQGKLTHVGRILKQWYLDELPQLINVVRGDILLIGTRPYPLDLYEDELKRGITRKRDMPAGLIGPVQASKGVGNQDPLALDLEYWRQLEQASALELLLIDLGILRRSIKVQLEHKGI